MREELKAPRVTISAEALEHIRVWTDCAAGMVAGGGCIEEQPDGTLHIREVVLPTQKASAGHVLLTDDPEDAVRGCNAFEWSSHGPIAVFFSSTDEQEIEHRCQQRSPVVTAVCNKHGEQSVRVDFAAPRRTFKVALEVVGDVETPDLLRAAHMTFEERVTQA